ncbi:MAG: hypothetical protein ACD_23C00415G0002 [uncultured bacterium]|nr:MAG: hypothetical protein ACD_23C00415G0002 [uncultured bacterium]
MRTALAYLLALVCGLGVLWIATPVPALFGLRVSASGGLLLVGFGFLLSILPYLVALWLLAKGESGQGAQMAAGAGVSAVSVGLLTAGFPQTLASFLFDLRTSLGVLLAGAVAGFIHHAVMSAERKIR